MSSNSLDLQSFYQSLANSQSDLQDQIQKEQEKKSKIESGLGIAESLGLPLSLEQLQQSNLASGLKQQTKAFLKNQFKTGDPDIDKGISDLLEGRVPTDAIRNRIGANLPSTGNQQIDNGLRAVVSGEQTPSDLLTETATQARGAISQARSTAEGAISQARQTGESAIGQAQEGASGGVSEGQGFFRNIVNKFRNIQKPKSYSGEDMTSRLNSLNPEANAQYLRLVDGDPLELGTDLPQSVFDFAKDQRESLLRKGIAIPRSQAEREIYNTSNSEGQIQPQRVLPENIQEPGQSSQRIGNLLRQQQQETIQMEPIGEIDDEPAQAEPAQATTVGETTVGEAAGETAGETAGKAIAKTVGKSIGEDVGEDVAEDSVLGPIGLLAGLGTGIASLVEDLKNKSVQPAVPLLQTGV